MVIGYLLSTKNTERYTPIYDDNHTCLVNERMASFFERYGSGKKVEITWKQLVFSCEQLETDDDERIFRDYLVLRGCPDKFVFFHRRLTDQLGSLFDQELQELPVKLRAGKGQIKEFCLVDVLNLVDGEIIGGVSNKPLITKNSDFLQNFKIARDKNNTSVIYISPALKELFGSSQRQELIPILSDAEG